MGFLTFITVVAFFAFLAFIAFVIAKRWRKRFLSSGDALRLWKAMAAAQGIPDPHRKILESEKVVDSALMQLGYSGSFADKLKRAGPRFSNIQPLWNAHKLRNRIAHEMHLQLSQQDVASAMAAFERALRELCR